jgi:hypothetical protein
MQAHNIEPATDVATAAACVLVLLLLQDHLTKKQLRNKLPSVLLLQT